MVSDTQRSCSPVEVEICYEKKSVDVDLSDTEAESSGEIEPGTQSCQQSS